jgi:mannose-6-phosphate isomerase-like protein (cupin superfamily)
MTRKEYYFKEGCFITELHNSADDPAVSVARARVEPGRTTRWHSLEDIIERYLLVEGSGRVEIDTEAGRDVGPGDVVLIPPGCRQRISNIGQGDLVFLAICTPRFVASAYRDREETA